MSALIMFRSLMFAQRGNRALAQGGIPANVVKAPRGTEEKGCSYGVRVSEKRLERALRLLEEQQVPHGRVYMMSPEGEIWEAAR